MLRSANEMKRVTDDYAKDIQKNKHLKLKEHISREIQMSAEAGISFCVVYIDRGYALIDEILSELKSLGYSTYEQQAYEEIKLEISWNKP